MEVLGISPVQRLVVPRVLACVLISVALNGLVCVVGVAGGYFFNVVLQGGTPGAYLASFSALAQLPDLYTGEIKASSSASSPASSPPTRDSTSGAGRRRRRCGEPVGRHHLHAAVRRQLRHHGRVLPGRPGEGLVTMATDIIASARRAVHAPWVRSTSSATRCPSTGGPSAGSRRPSPGTRKRRCESCPRFVFGSGSLAVIGGTVGVIAFMSFFTGTEVGLQGYAALSQLGVASYSGFITAFFNTREIAPDRGRARAVGHRRLRLHRPTRGHAHQRGDRRPRGDGGAEPAVPGDDPIVAGFIAVIPLYIIGLLSSYLASYVIVVYYYHDSAGTYSHYFHLFLPPEDVILGPSSRSWSSRSDHPHALLLRLQRVPAGRPASASQSGGRSGWPSSPSRSPTSSCPSRSGARRPASGWRVSDGPGIRRDRGQAPPARSAAARDSSSA